jgi:hypothetical protein
VKTTAERVAELADTAPPITDEQREAVVRILATAIRRRPDLPLGIMRSRKAAD